MGGDVAGRGHSVWLMPEGRARATLAAWISRLAERLRSEPFQPHVTLVPGLDGPAADLVVSVERAAAALAPFTVHLDGVDGRDEHFRCLFLPAVETPALRAAHASVSRALEREPDPGFLPHLSLVYGALLQEQKRGLASEIGCEADVRFEARRLHLWRTEGPVRDWREVGVFPFTGR